MGGIIARDRALFQAVFTAPRCRCVNFAANFSPFSALTGLPDLTRPMARVAACLITVRAALLVMLDVLRVVKEASFVPPAIVRPLVLSIML